MGNRLRILDNLRNKIDHDNVAFEGDLVCECGNMYFEIYHTGKQTKGILAPYLIRKDNQIAIIGKCICCGHETIIYDTSVDSKNKQKSNIDEKQKFIIKNSLSSYKVHMMYNYLEENYKSDSFEECFIGISNNSIKSKVLFED